MAKKSLFGIARWIFEGDTKKLKQAAEEAKETIKDVGDEGVKAGAGIGEGFGKAGERIEKSTEGVRKFVGAIGSTIGVVTGLLGAVTAVVGIFVIFTKVLTANRAAAKAQKEALSDLSDAMFEFEDTAVETQEEAYQAFRRTTEAIDAKNGVVKRALLDEQFLRAKAIYDEKLLAAKARETMKVYDERSRVEREGRRAQIDAIRTLDDLIEDMEIQLLPEEEQFQAELDRRKRLLIEAMKATGAALPEGLLEEAFAFMDEIEARRKRELEERHAAEAKALRERLDTEYEAKMKASRDAAVAFADSLTASTGDFTTRLDTIVREIQNVSRTNGRR